MKLTDAQVKGLRAIYECPADVVIRSGIRTGKTDAYDERTVHAGVAKQLWIKGLVQSLEGDNGENLGWIPTVAGLQELSYRGWIVDGEPDAKSTEAGYRAFEVGDIVRSRLTGVLYQVTDIFNRSGYRWHKAFNVQHPELRIDIVDTTDFRKVSAVQS